MHDMMKYAYDTSLLQAIVVLLLLLTRQKLRVTWRLDVIRNSQTRNVADADLYTTELVFLSPEEKPFVEALAPATLLV